MLLTNHALTGALLGLSIENEAILMPTALASHFVLDVFPHVGGTNLSFKRPAGFIIGSIDLTTATLVTIVIALAAPDRAVRVFIGSFFACLPDFFHIPEILTGKRIDGAIGRFHIWIQWGESPFGLTVDIAYAMLMLYLIRTHM